MNPRSKEKSAERAQEQASIADMKDSASLSNRIRTSASGLSQDSFGRPSPRAIAETLGSLNEGISKVGASSSASPGEASSSSHPPLTQGESLSSGLSFVAESFRSKGLRGGIDSEEPQTAFNEFAASPGVLETDCVATQFALASMNIYGLNPEHTAGSNDGAAVVALLSNPGFNVDEESTDAWLVPTNDKGTARLGAWPIEQHTQNPINPSIPVKPMDLVPDFDYSMVPTKQFPSPHERTAFIDPALDDIQPWIDIINSYHDEVWGDMLPLTKEAREEIKTATSSAEGALQDRPALRRLGMLLKHLNRPI